MARCCVETLQALRENSASVLTIVEVKATAIARIVQASCVGSVICHVVALLLLAILSDSILFLGGLGQL